MSSRHRAKAFITKNYKYLLFCAILAIADAAFILLNSVSLNQRALWLLPFSLIFLIFCAIGFYLKKKKNFALHQIFLVFAIPLGIMLLFAFPLGAIPDEENHFRRAYEISEGHLISDHTPEGIGGNTLPDSIETAFSVDHTEGDYEDVFEVIGDTADLSTSSFQTFGNTSLYSLVPYLPQSVGILLGRILHFPMAAIAYIARIFNFIFWIIFMYFALKFIPVAKNALALIILSPISIQAAVSCSADVMTNVAIIGLIAFVLYKLKNATLLTKKEKIIAIALSSVLALSKIVYLPLCFLLFLLPKSCFRSKKDKIIKTCVVAGGAVVLNFFWLAISSRYLVEFQPGVNSLEQVRFVLTHPFSYLGIFFHTFSEGGLNYLLDSFSPSLGYFNIGISKLYVIVLLLFTFYTYLREDKNAITIKPSQKFIITIILACVVALIATSLYVQWTALRASTIDGIQGRYFTALLPLALLLITPLGTKSSQDNTIYAFSMIAAVDLYAISTVIAYYL